MARCLAALGEMRIAHDTHYGLSAHVWSRDLDKAIQTHGGFGYAKEYHVERLYREAAARSIAFDPVLLGMEAAQ